MKKITRRYFIAGGLAALAGAGGYSWDLWRRFGALPDTEPVSPNWQNGSFQNLPDNYIYDQLDQEPVHNGGWVDFLLDRKGSRFPPAPVPSMRSDLKSLQDGEFVWLGHSSFLLKLAGKIICIDPVLASRASPIPFTIPAWPGASPYQVEDFPAIDYLCISHDHWDHLDYKAVSSLQFAHALCGKGAGAHFARWNLPQPIELDWGEEWQGGPLKFLFTPAKHFSGRGLTRNQSLWGGFAINAGSGGSVYYTGDGGYGNHFVDIGKNFGPFDLVLPDSGQYDRAWANVHMFPEQAARSARDARGRMACPAHIGKFTLAWHAWDEPAKRFAKGAAELGHDFMLPLIGEKCGIDGKRNL